MTFIYTRSQLKSRVNAGIHGRIGVLIDEDDFINDVAREVNTDIDMASTIRRGTLSPKLFNGIYDYTAPSDLKEQAIIDVPPQIKRDNGEWYLTTPEEFLRTRERDNNIIAIEDANGIKKLLLSKNLDDENRVISELDSTTSGGGTWIAFGDGTNITADQDDFVKGAGSINWDINAAAGTTAGIQNTGLEDYDIEDFMQGNGAAFVWVKITSTTGLTNFILRLGTDSSNYYYKTITSAHDGTGFVEGWNLLRFDLTSLSSSGSPAQTSLNYAAIYMTKTTGKISETDYRFDWLVLKRGQIYQTKYYSKFPWVSAAGAYLENSTDDSDFIVADSTEYNLYILKGKQMAAEEANEFEIAGTYERQYIEKKGRYVKQNPSLRRIETTEYYHFGSNN